MNLPVSWDNRGFAARMRRRDLWLACDHFNINYRPGAPATECRALLEAHNVGDQELMDYMQRKNRLQVTEGKDEHGRHHREFYPVSEPHETARMRARGEEIDYDQIIEKKAAEAAQREAVIDNQTNVINALMQRLEALESSQLPLTSYTPPQLKKLAKQRGIDTTGLKSKDDLIAALGG